MKQRLTLLMLLFIHISLYAQQNMLSNGSFEGLINQGIYPRRNERFAQHPAPGWIDYRNGLQSAWFYDSLWVQPNINVIDPQFQNGFFKDSICSNHASAFDRFYTQQSDSLELLRASDGHFFVGFDAAAGIDDGPEGVQQILAGCPLNSGTYRLQMQATRAFKGGTVWRDQEINAHRYHLFIGHIFLQPHPALDRQHRQLVPHAHPLLPRQPHPPKPHPPRQCQLHCP